jgi:hypothetical protein
MDLQHWFLPLWFPWRGLTRATYILCIELPRPGRVSVGNRTRDLLHCRRTLYAKSHSNGVIDCYLEPQLVLLQLPPSRDVASSWLGILAEFDSDADIFYRTCGGPNSERRSKVLKPLLHAREQGARTSEPRENRITLGSPLCRGLTRATYILCIEHPRPKRLSRESNPGPPALQANTLCKEPFERRYWLLFGTLPCTTTPRDKDREKAQVWQDWSQSATVYVHSS